MEHQHVQNNQTTSAVTTSLFSIVLSFLATSHHWLHTLILVFMGSSTNMVATMSGITWLRRAMILVTLLTTLYSIYRLLKHQNMPVWMKIMSVLSIMISVGLILYTLISFGW